jgi:hypothetical protein
MCKTFVVGVRLPKAPPVAHHRKCVMMRRGILASDAQGKPGAGLSATAMAEADYLLTRLARDDPRAAARVYA